jgi:hypothetical protein
MLDLFVGYDHRVLDIASRDLTTFQTPLGAYRCTVLPQGATNAVAIFHGDVTFILEPEIPDIAKPFLDDTVVRGPASRYERPGGEYETIPENPGIRRFVWEHLNDVHRVIHRLRHAGATVSAPKIFLATPEVIILGHKCTYEGRIPDDSKVARIKTWPPCSTVTDVRAFLGLSGYMRIWIKDYSSIARPLVNLTRKETAFVWEDQHADAMQALKDAIVASPALIPIDYTTDRPVFLAVDSSTRAVGWILSQQCEDGRRRPSRFGSIAWNERESRYSQAKIELYGLFRALRALRIHIVGITNLIVEMDALYVKGMLSNPDMQLNAAINRWIAAISLFHFKLVHVPADKHRGPDGLSRREPVPGEDDDEGDPEEWIDEVLSLGIWVDSLQKRPATQGPQRFQTSQPSTHKTTAVYVKTQAATRKTANKPPNADKTPTSDAPTFATRSHKKQALTSDNTRATATSTPDTSQRRKNKTSHQIKTVCHPPPSSTANPSTPSIASDIATAASDTAPQDQDIVPDNTTNIPQAQVTQQNVPQIRITDTTAFDTPSTHQVPETSNITADTNVTAAPQEQDFDTLDIDNTNIAHLQDFSTTAVLDSTIDPKLTPTFKTQARNAELDKILKFLINPAQVRLPTAQLTQLIKKARHFFTCNGRLWRKQAQGRHQLVLLSYQRLPTLREAHDDLGHRGYYSTVRMLLDRFWWPTLAQDVKTHIQTCHECQLRQTTKIRIPPTVAIPAPLFRKAYIDTMLMPPAAGFRYIVQARCSLTAWPEWRVL